MCSARGGPIASLGEFVKERPTELIGSVADNGIVRFTAGKLKVEIHPHKKAAGAAAAEAVAEEMHRLNRVSQDIAIIFATGASQIDMLQALISMSGLPWKAIQG